jgi:hypothetical protein
MDTFHTLRDNQANKRWAVVSQNSLLPVLGESWSQEKCAQDLEGRNENSGHLCPVKVSAGPATAAAHI